jgi:hypothetical protein
MTIACCSYEPVQDDQDPALSTQRHLLGFQRRSGGKRNAPCAALSLHTLNRLAPRVVALAGETSRHPALVPQSAYSIVGLAEHYSDYNLDSFMIVGEEGDM